MVNMFKYPKVGKECVSNKYRPYKDTQTGRVHSSTLHSMYLVCYLRGRSALASCVGHLFTASHALQTHFAMIRTVHIKKGPHVTGIVIYK